MTAEPTGALSPLGGTEHLPDPTELKRWLTAQMEVHVTRLRQERGENPSAEDCFDLIRKLTAVRERMGDYSRAFEAVGKSAKGELEIELAEAVGEQDGVPTSNLRVPTAGGDITLKRDTENVYDIDMDQVIGVLAAQVMAEWEARFYTALEAARHPLAQPDVILPSDDPAQFAIEVAQRALAFVGAAKPKVTAVRALADELARAGDDQLAKVARDAIGKTVKYRGIKVERAAS